MITPTTMPMMRRAEGACRVLFMTFFSFSFCFSPFCCFCVENSGLEPGFNGRFVQSFANDDEHILPLPADSYECAMSAERGWWQVIAKETGERVYHGIGPVDVVVSPAPF